MWAQLETGAGTAGVRACEFGRRLAARAGCWGADAPQLGALTGAFWEDKRRCLQATGFIIKADGTVAQALYSTGPIGRYTAAEALKILEKIVAG